MTATERLSRRALDLMPEPHPSDSPPQDIILTVSLVMLLIKIIMLAWQCWENGGKAVSIAQNPGWIQRWYLRRIIKKVLVANGQGDKVGRVMSALLQMAAAVTPEDIEAVFEEAQKDKEIWTYGKSLGIL